MKIRVVNGHGRPVGMLEISDDLVKDFAEVSVCWSARRKYSTNTFATFTKSLNLTLDPVVPFGWEIRLKWKERTQLKRAGLILPYVVINRISWGGGSK